MIQLVIEDRTIHLVIVLSWLLKFLFLGVVLVLGWWTYRRIRLRSLPWLAGYLILATPLSLASSHMLQRALDDGPVAANIPFGLTLGQFLTVWNAGTAIVNTVGYLLLAILIFSDVFYVLSRAGIALAGEPIQALLHARRHASLFGVALLVPSQP